LGGIRFWPEIGCSTGTQGASHDRYYLRSAGYAVYVFLGRGKIDRQEEAGPFIYEAGPFIYDVDAQGCVIDLEILSAS
ncbi:MAG TPA: hypothetical protein VNJ31_01645, partial [Methyloceanibacter sp.]|nr:hypothetical protein [Methyloceanibacter sp.]